ncbi:uncharacterized protein B0P05DRAFT_533389 [Gilbertella persicaria]|uniref:uncharacterized protein n=1 Tax=Gilbertella persicaria TaxID=101096 RepID=UPI00221F1D3C|nr:uncharacterized protein B0P05DRAFT_533389 [Gilbertella persicaria]KAI8087022.1 hypothetical protein B0P05DRAFT_533389 [Gilbertella persicaria]
MTTESLINDTLVQLSQEDTIVLRDGFMHMLSTLYTAASLSVFFFKHLFGFLYTCVCYTCLPFLWLLRACWTHFVIKPLDMCLYVFHVLYPVIMFCLAAMGCGLFIGGCAGFAAEACSSLLISATWGPQPKQIKQAEPNVEQEPIPRRALDHRPSSSSSTTSLWDSRPFSSKGKEPLRSPRVEDWRDSLSQQSYSSPRSRSSSPPVLIRRMKLSSTNKSSSWDWEDDEDDLFTSHRKKNV